MSEIEKQLQAKLSSLHNRLAEAIDNNNLISVRLIEAEIDNTQEYLKQEQELNEEINGNS